MRILMTLHHRLSRDSGAPGVTLAIAEALERNGCKVSWFSFDEAFRKGTDSKRVGVQFPLSLASFLAKHAGSYDIVDASSGDAWLWASMLRPGSGGAAALITRSHGLEHVADKELRRDARAGKTRLRRRYYLYHGGYRLWEVSRSMQLADHSILLNQIDLQYARTRLHVPPERSSIIPHGVHDRFFKNAIRENADGTIKLAFTGSWIERKGIGMIVRAMSRLIESGIKAELVLLGSGSLEPVVLAAFPNHVRDFVRAIPSFPNSTLPDLLSGNDVVLLPSRSEGFSLALVESMAAGLVPVATAVGSAPEVISDGQSGFLIPYGDDERFVERLTILARDQPRLMEMRRAARQAVARFKWDTVAMETIAIYKSAIERVAKAQRR